MLLNCIQYIQPLRLIRVEQHMLLILNFKGQTGYNLATVK